MLLLRMAAAASLFLASAGTGLWMAARLQARVRALERLERLFIRLESLILQRLPTSVLTGELMREGLLPEGGWEALVSSLPSPESALCARVSALVGRGDAGSQASALETGSETVRSVRLAAEELRASALDARQAAREKGKLYPTLGLMLGMLAVVLAL